MTGAAGVGHLSIGEVLALVQQDFPDVTISKIRFLESQGLIAPERTAAGYRKFYDSDIERLRWILSQQRDHFLPLKVIRKMLDQGVDVAPSSETQPTLWTAAATGPAGGPDAASIGEDPSEVGHGVPNGTGGSETLRGPTIDVTDPRGVEVSAGTSEEDRERSTYRSPAHPAVASAPRSVGASAAAGRRGSIDTASLAGSDAGPSIHGDADGVSGPAPDEATSSGASGPTERSEATTQGSQEPRRRRAAYSTPADVVAALQEEPRSRRRGGGSGGDEPGSVVGAGAEGGGDAAEAAPGRSSRSRGSDRETGAARSTVRMGREDLCAAAGISPELLGDLEAFGLIEPTVLGGDPQYDSYCVEVAKLAARYAELGVGARHLRMYKVAAEREAGFVEQLVVPLIKQRNPEAHAEARARSDELQQMGSDLHATLLRRRIEPSLGD